MHVRAEDAGRLDAYHEVFDLVVARAVAPLPTLVEYLLPLAKVSGCVISYKAAAAEAEAERAAKGIVRLGKNLQIHSVKVPGLSERRSLIVIKKVSATPSPFPRGKGLARKNPL